MDIIESTIEFNDNLSDVYLSDNISESCYNCNHSNYSYYGINDNSNYDINYFIKLFKRNISKYNIIGDINENLINGNLSKLIYNNVYKNKQDLLFFTDIITYQITTIYNQKNNAYYNISTIDLEECEKKLINHFKISNNENLIIFKYEYFLREYLIPIIEYEIFNLNTSKILDLSICKDIKINIVIPASIDENNLFKYNSSHEYYNDICFPYTTKDKTDIIIKDRRNEFINNNLSLCEKDCSYKGYDLSTKKAKCECYIKIKLSSFDEIRLNKDLLLKKFKDLKYTSNILVIKCYKILFTKGGLITNIGNYILLSIIFISLILTILFRIKGYKRIINQIKELVLIENSKYKNENKLNNKRINPIILNLTLYFKKNTNISDKNIPQSTKNYKQKEVLNINKIKGEDISHKSNDKLLLSNLKNINYLSNNNTIKNILIKSNDYELNSLTYKKALEKDKRTYFQYYLSLLKTKHLIIFTFYTSTDYNSRIIKIILFLFSFSLYFTVNALFFTDSTMHKIYEEKGNVNFIYYIPQIIYSTIISSVISFIIKFLSLSEKNIIEIKTTKENKSEKALKILKCLNIKFVLFFILCFIFLFLFWYYLSCFCAVYVNTQIHLIKDTLTSFGLSLIYPFGINLIPGIFRINSLKDSKKNHELIYKFSQILQMI